MVWKLLFSEVCCNCLNVFYLRIFGLFSECYFYTLNFQVIHPRCVFNNYIYIYIYIYILYCKESLFLNFATGFGVMIFLSVCLCHCSSVVIWRLYVILWEYVLFTECLFYSRNIVVFWTFILFSECLYYCHMLLLLHFEHFYSLHICVFLGMIILFAECWYFPSVADVLWMSVFCEYLCYALKFVLLSENFCCSLVVCVVILPSVKSVRTSLSCVCQY